MRSPLLRYLLAAAFGLAGAGGVLILVAGRLVDVGGTDLPLACLVPPVAGLALFQLVFGTATGWWRGLGFWLAALPLTVLVWGAALILLLDGRIAIATALAGVAAAMVLGGLIALAGTARGRRVG